MTDISGCKISVAMINPKDLPQLADIATSDPGSKPEDNELVLKNLKAIYYTNTQNIFAITINNSTDLVGGVLFNNSNSEIEIDSIILHAENQDEELYCAIVDAVATIAADLELSKVSISDKVTQLKSICTKCTFPIDINAHKPMSSFTINTSTAFIPRIVPQSKVEDLRSFYVTNYSQKHALANVDHFTWQYISNPQNPFDTSIVILEDESEIIGQIGLCPFELKVLDQDAKGIWFMNSLVIEKYRGMGLGSLFYGYATKQGDFVFALNYTEDAKKYYERNNWIHIATVNRYVGILDQTRISAMIKDDLPGPVSKTSATSDVTSQRIKELPEEYNDFWKQTKSRYPITCNRTAEFLKWRYLNHALIDYHFLAFSRSNKLVGYAVIRFEDKNEELKAARVVDLVCTEDVDQEVISQISEYCRGKADFVDFYCTGLFYDEAFKSLGFFNQLDHPKLMIPTRFNPLDLEIMSMMDLIFKCTNEQLLALEEIKDKNQWFVVKGDSDQDRAF